jgi:CheY-like chemotaxis protein
MAHLLLVDDDNDIVEAFGDLLRGEGHEVHCASTGEEGLVVLRASPLPDALVLDVDMPILGETQYTLWRIGAQAFVIRSSVYWRSRPAEAGKLRPAAP